MSQQVIDTVGFSGATLGHYFDFQVNNTFYMLAPDYYYQLYSIYFARCLACYDGWITGWHNTKSGLVPQRLLQSIARGLNNMLFAHGIDFTGDSEDYRFACEWAKRTKAYKAMKKAHLYAIAGGTSLLKLNREGNELYATAHRIDTFFVDTDARGKVTSAKIYYDAIHSTNSKAHFDVCEERYFNEQGMPCVRCAVYRVDSNLQTDVQTRPANVNAVQRVNWENLPNDVKREIKKNYPSVIIGKEQYLPFPNHLGCVLLRFTDDIGQIPNTQFGQPIGDILFTESFQYDQMKYFEKNEVDLAKARALIPDEMWNRDDPDYPRDAMSDRFYQKVSTIGNDTDKITPIQFMLRGNDIKTQTENILKACAVKLNVSASSIASFLSEGAGAKTATEIVNERTKTDTWINGQISLNKPEIDELLAIVMRYYNHSPVEIILKSENQSPFLETAKILGDQLAIGNISPELYVHKVYKDLTAQQQQKEIEEIRANKEKRSQTGGV